MRSARGARAVSMRGGSFTIRPVAGSRYVRVSVVVVRVSDAIGAEGEVDGAELDGDDGDDGVEVTPGLVVDGAGVAAPGLSVVVAGRSGVVDCAPATPARHSNAAPTMSLDLCMVELLWKVCRSNMLPPFLRSA